MGPLYSNYIALALRPFVGWIVISGNVGGPLPSVELKLASCDGLEDPKDQEGEQYLAIDEDHYGEPKKGWIARAQEGINSKSNTIDIIRYLL